MGKLKFILPAFILLVLVQWYIPSKMIFNNEEIIALGIPYKFKTAPIDPYDPFRGKYIVLRYEEDRFGVDTCMHYDYDQKLFVTLTTDVDGFAKIANISEEKPSNDQDFVIGEFSGCYAKAIRINYPFNKFFMEESKAKPAELVHREARRDRESVSYGLVYVHEGQAVLTDVMINDTSISVLAEQYRDR